MRTMTALCLVAILWVAALVLNHDPASSPGEVSRAELPPSVEKAQATQLDQAYCDAVKENFKRFNWRIQSCDETTDRTFVGGMVDIGGAPLWYFEALKSAYPFPSNGDDIQVAICEAAVTREFDVLATSACRASGELRKMCEKTPGPFDCNKAPDSKGCLRWNAICAQELRHNLRAIEAQRMPGPDPTGTARRLENDASQSAMPPSPQQSRVAQVDRSAVAEEPTLRPKAAEKPSFDCAKARTAAARLICGDAELARLDGELGGAFNKQRVQTTAAERASFVESQLAWIRDRNKRCGLDGNNNAALEVLAASKPCLMTALRERINFLSQPEVPLTLRSAPPPAQDSQVQMSENTSSRSMSGNSLPMGSMPTQFDNYPEVGMSHYAQVRKAFLDLNRVAFFAAGCRVFQVPDTLQQVSAQLILGQEYERLQREPLGASDRTIQNEATKAMREGLARAAQPAACDYWHEHTDAVDALRRAARAASP